MSSPAIRSLLIGSSKRLLLLDSNLLLLWLTATYDMRLLQSFKRVEVFTQDDAVLLAWIIDQYKSVVTTAHIVTETSKLGNSLSSKAREGWFASLAEFSLNTPEETLSLRSLAGHKDFIRFGITDCALSTLSGKYQVLTMDHRLSGVLHEAGKSVLNFNQLRQMV